MRCIGVLCLERREGTEQETDHLLLELIARYVSIVIFNAVVKLATKYRDIEVAQDEARRASWEDSLLHVQNMVLDNCLSTIKHETIYYPNKIKQLIGKLRSGKQTEAEERETVVAISELIEYYKGIFTTLSSCASRQLEEVISGVRQYLCRNLWLLPGNISAKCIRETRRILILRYNCWKDGLPVTRNSLRFLLENLIDEACSVTLDGAVCLSAREDGEFIRFLFTDMRREKTREELNQLSDPDLSHMTAGEKRELYGTEYLVCKQIIRDHDEFAGRRGCRINAEPGKEGGFTIYFTLPKK